MFHKWQSFCPLSVDELPDFDEEVGVLAAIEEDETVEVEIELKEEEPAFLKGYGRQSLQVRKVSPPSFAFCGWSVLL